MAEPEPGGRGREAAEQLKSKAERLKSEADRLLNIDAQRALVLADQILQLDADQGVRALGLLTRADALRELGRHAEAVQAYEEAARLFRELGDAVGWARTRIGITIAVRYTGTHSHVLAELDEARAVLTRHKLWPRLSRLEKNGGVLLAALGRGEEALAALERALTAAALVEPRDERLEAEVLFEISIAYWQVDQHDRAEEFLRQATSIFEQQGQLEYVARAQRNFARYAAGRGHYSKALAYVLPGRRTLLESGRINAAAHFGEVGVDCLIRLNRFAEAVELAEQVATEFEATGARVEAALTHRLRSQALARLGQNETALEELERAQELYGSAEWEPGPAYVRLGRAVVLGEMGQWPRALAEAETARDELIRHGWAAGAAQAELVRGRALRALGQPQEAEGAANGALRLIGDRSLQWLSYHAWRQLGDLARDRADCSTAQMAYLEAISSLEHVQGRILTEYRGSFLADKSDVYEAAVDLLLAADETERAFELVERAKSRALLDALAGGLDIRVRAATQDHQRMVDELTRLRREHDALVERSEARPETRKLEQRITDLLEELRLAGVDDLERLSLLEGRVYSPQAELDATTALVEFYRISEDLVVFVMDRDSLRAERLVGVVPQLLRLEGSLTLNLQGATVSPRRRDALEPNARVLLGRVYNGLLRPVADWLASYERLLIVPHGQLHRIPFGALHDGRQYLIERFELAMAPSASSLTFCLRPRTRQGSRALIGAHSAAGELPGAIEEARAVGALFEGDSLVENDLTLAELRKRCAGADLIHLAAHGVSRPDAPLFSYLRLADGHLTALDCFDLELDCALVTLSACESGRGVVAPGDEQIGLPRAFLYAGARSVVHSLWRIDDRVTRLMMTEFYEGLKRGLGRAAALREAQLACIQAEGAHPFLWAGLELTGDWRREGGN